MERGELLKNWITDGTAKPFYARKEFELKELPVRASARVCGLGQFVFRLNGRKVGDHELDPGWTDYRKYIQYVTFDVLEYLHAGRNAAGIEVGSGWYIMELSDGHYTFHFPPFMPPNPNPYRPYGKSLILALDLILTYADGRCEIVRTDTSWKTAPHAITSTNVYGSERMDGRLVPKDWDLPGFDDSAWMPAMAAKAPAVPLKEQTQPAVKIIHTYEARLLHTLQLSGKTRTIYDIGQNCSCILEFEARGLSGEEVRIYPAEKLDETGDADQMAKGWMPIDTCITYLIGEDDVWETCRMTFTYAAGRYFAVEGAARIRGLKAHAITSAWQEAGHFTCDDERYLQIYDMIERTVEANLLSVHTDCPTIERFAWQEPNHLMAPSIFYMKDGNALWRKFLADLRAAQHTKNDRFRDLGGREFCPGDGLVPSQAPCYIPNVLPVPGMGSFYDIIAWGSTCILGTYWHYLFYGEKDIIEENYETGLRYLAHLKTKVDGDGFICHGLGDWGNPTGEYARENVETAFLYADAKTLAYFAEILGREADRAELLAYAEKVRNNYNKKLLVWDAAADRYCYRVWDGAAENAAGDPPPGCGSAEETATAGAQSPAEIGCNDVSGAGACCALTDETNHGTVCGGWKLTQAAEALPLYWGMVPQEKVPDVEAAFRDVLIRDGSFLCGEVGQPYVIQMASRLGMNDVICRYILKETHPSYYAFLLDGETTLGEYWETNPRSHCHDMMGHIIEWYYNGIAGIRPLEPGFTKVLVKPYLPPGMCHLDCTYSSAAGDIRVRIDRREDGSAALDVCASDSITVEIDTSCLA